MKKKNLVEIKNLYLEIKGKLILNNISFSFGYNEIIGVVGESGSGKSLIALTLIHKEIKIDKRKKVLK